MSSVFSNRIQVSVFGESHGAAIGVTLDSIPAGLPVDIPALQEFLCRRAPGNTPYSTARKETDAPEFLSGIKNGHTTGAPIHCIIRNANANSGDYDSLADTPRPGHADFTAYKKFGEFRDVTGGGHFSGRLTVALCVAGGLCKQWLELSGIHIGAHISRIAGIPDLPEKIDWLDPDLSRIRTDFPVINAEAGEKMKQAIQCAATDGDSVGGTVTCFVSGVPAGLGDPIFDGMENRIARIIYAIPAVKGLEFGSGFSGSDLRGSENNDPFTVSDGKITTLTNMAGGILGGITTGMPIVFNAAFKPTPSIAKKQQSVNLSTGKQSELTIAGRHDPCIVPRAVPVVEAAAAIAMYDAFLSR